MALVATILGLSQAANLADAQASGLVATQADEMQAHTMEGPGEDEPEYDDIDYDNSNFLRIRDLRDQM